jgi:UDP-N-acetylmuramate dehydrogenase
MPTTTPNTPLKPFNTFGLSVNAKHFAKFTSIEELSELTSNLNNEPLLIIGGGSNILFTKDFDGLVLHNEIKGFQILEENEETVIVESGAGEVWHDFVMWTLSKDFGGLENLSLIPGSVGASPMQNIGAYGVEIKDVFHHLSAYHLESGEIHQFTSADCAFGYRESVFKHELKGKYVIVSVAFKLTKKNHVLKTSYGAIQQELEQMGILEPTIQDISAAVIRIRQSKLPDPKEIGNAGSFFKNPVVSKTVLDNIKVNFPNVPSYPVDENQVKLAAGWLIEQAGWKGKTFDTYGIHKLQALVLVNYGGSTGKQIYDLSQQIIEDISNKFGVMLEREVNIL